MASIQYVESAQPATREPAPRSGNACWGDRSAPEKRGIFVAWFLLGVEVSFAYYLYSKGEGRTAETVDGECVEGIGPQRVSGLEFVRAGLAAICQLLLLAAGQPIDIPERAFFNVMALPFTLGDGAVSLHFFCIGALSSYCVYPTWIIQQSVCALKDAFSIFWVVGAVLTVVICSNLYEPMGSGEGRAFRWKTYAKIVASLDDLVTGSFSTWANVVQSGLLSGIVFAVLPIFELVYSIVTECML